ncbi:MAG: hypothetical protein KF819_10365 [Labilithrix sp.]|nr:hypothetical protein [Labilithrix sp.]
MEYVKAYNKGRGPERLDGDATRESVSLEAREAALAFMSGAASGWDKLDLALWLTGPYARATRHTMHGERFAVIGAEEIADETLVDLVEHARSRVLAELEEASLDCGALDFAAEAVERGHVKKATDVEGRPAWYPVDGARTTLEDRVKSLFVADYLNTPYAYAELFVCHRCRAVAFDDAAKTIGLCGAHRSSGIVPKEGATAVDDESIAS